MPGLKVVLDNLGFPEDPRWHDDALWFSDMDKKAVLKREPSGQVTTILPVDGIPSGLGWLPTGSLLVVSMSDRRLLSSDLPVSVKSRTCRRWPVFGATTWLSMTSAGPT